MGIGLRVIWELRLTVTILSLTRGKWWIIQGRYILIEKGILGLVMLLEILARVNYRRLIIKWLLLLHSTFLIGKMIAMLRLNNMMYKRLVRKINRHRLMIFPYLLREVRKWEKLNSLSFWEKVHSLWQELFNTSVLETNLWREKKKGRKLRYRCHK